MVMEGEINSYFTIKEEPERYKNFHRYSKEQYFSFFQKEIECSKLPLEGVFPNKLAEVIQSFSDTIQEFKAPFSLIHHKLYNPSGYAIEKNYIEIKIKDLKLGEINYNKFCVLEIKTIISYNYNINVNFLAEDINGDIVFIQISNLENYYPSNRKGDIEDCFIKQGAFIIVINPFYKLIDQCLLDGIRIESPEEYIILNKREEVDNFIKKNQDRYLINLKELGNIMHENYMYEKAIYYYGLAIEEINRKKFELLTKEEMKLKIIIYSNISESYLLYKYFTKSLEYIDKTIEIIFKVENNENSTDTVTLEKDFIHKQKQKIIYKKIRALYGLRKYSFAYKFIYNRFPIGYEVSDLDYLQIFNLDLLKGIKINKFMNDFEYEKFLSMNQIKELIQEINSKIKNEKGEYDFVKMVKDENLYLYLDYGNFYNPKLTYDFNEKKGVFIKTENKIEKGELLIVEKGLGVEGEKSMLSLNYSEKKNYTYNHYLDNMKKRYEDYKHYLLLAYNKNKKLSISERVELIREKNYTQEELEERLNECFKTTKRIFDFSRIISNGLFFVSSFLNHSCNENTLSIGIGDFIIYFALRKISKGEEIITAYFDMGSLYQERQNHIVPLIKCN